MTPLSAPSAFPSVPPATRPARFVDGTGPRPYASGQVSNGRGGLCGARGLRLGHLWKACFYVFGVLRLDGALESLAKPLESGSVSNGSVAREKLVTMDEGLHRVVYAIVDGRPKGFRCP